MRVVIVLHSPHFERAFKKLPRSVRLEALTREKWFRADCFDSRLKTHKLSGRLADAWAFSVTQKYRIPFRFITDTEVVFDDIDDHDMYR